MKSSTLIWLIIFVLGGLGLLYSAALRPGGMAREYVKAVPISEQLPEVGERWISVPARDSADPGVQLSLPRSIGLWIAAFFTLAILSFLYGDNPFYKVAEAVFIGTSAAYYMVAGFWDTIVKLLLGKLMPAIIKGWAEPDLIYDATTAFYERNEFWVRLAPLVLGVMLLWRLAPKGQWIARWPLAIIIGTTAGIRLVAFIQSDLLSQVNNTIVPLVVFDGAGQLDPWQSLRNVGVVVCVMTCLVYFFFSVEHKGAVGRVARTGIWVLMITFGASFALTVMGRIALLSERINFLLDDWLWLIDPTNSRAL
jgi:hypothetical protein